MSGPQCCANPPTLNPNSGAGHVEKLGGLNAYVTGSPDSKLAVLLISDVYGYEAPNLRKLADKVAAAGFYVAVPDFFHGDPYVADGGKPLQEWIKDHGVDKGFEEAKPVIQALKSKGITAIGAAGFCWGAKVVVQLGKREFIQAAVLLHPSFVTVDDIKGVEVPLSILGAEIDRLSPPALVKEFEEALNAISEVDSFVKIFPKVAHGWTVRYNVEDETAVKAAEEPHYTSTRYQTFHSKKLKNVEPKKKKKLKNEKDKKQKKKFLCYFLGKIKSSRKMALNLTHQIGTLAGTPIQMDTGVVSGDSTGTVNASAVWKPVSTDLRCAIQKPDLKDTMSPPVSPCRSPVLSSMRADLSVACRAFATESPTAAAVTEFSEEVGGEMYKQGGLQEKGNGVPVFVMMPLDSVTMSNTVNRKKAMDASLRALKSAGVEGVMMDVWWGLVERDQPGHYNWGGYSDLLEMAKRHGLKVQAVMSFHQCGGNVGDSVSIPLPKWVVEEVDKDQDLVYTDQWGMRNYEYISLGCDTIPVLKGRMPVQCYSDFMRAFKDKFKDLLGDTIVEIQVGMGPAGELRYPSYPEQNGTWKFPGIGAFQCYDKYMLSSLKAAAESAGKPEWGSTGPTDAGHYNNWPEDTQFFRKENGGWCSPYGEFFLSWYSQMLLDHGERILSSAKAIFDATGVKISVKVAGIHWHYGSRSHAPELTAGYYNTRFRDGYLPIAQMLARHGAIFNFTCIEMRDHEQPQDALCAPEKLVKQVASATQKAHVPLAGENALPRYDEYAHEQILRAASLDVDKQMCAFTYLRMNPHLFQPDNWRQFVAFVKKMNEGKDVHRCLEQVEREAEHFVHVTQPLVQEAAVALMH